MNSIDKEHLINCNENILDKAIYRVFKIEHLLEWFKTGKLAFCGPAKWKDKDPWEAYYFKESFHLSKDRWVRLYFINLFYAKCWSYFEQETDIIWKLYCPAKDGVRVKTSIGKLYNKIVSCNEFINYKHQYHAPECFIGKVKYYNDFELKKTKAFEKYFNVKTKTKVEEARIDKSTVSYLFKKRKAFFHEKEFRFVFCTNDFDRQYNTIPKLFPLSINPFEVIEEIIFDPRMERKLFEEYRRTLWTYKFINPITQSKLYEI